MNGAETMARNGDKERAEAKVPAEGWGIFGVFLPYLYTAPSMHGTPRLPCGKGRGVFCDFIPNL